MSGREMRSKGHALFVAWGFPPSKSGGVFRMMTLANVLVEEGWQVTVLACDIDDLRRYAGCDYGTLDQIDPRVEVVRVPMELGPHETDLHRWDELRATDPKAWAAAYTARVEPMFPNGVYALWEAPALAAAELVHASHPVDVSLASGGPFVSFAICKSMRDRYGIPYVLDYRDSWSLQQFTDERLYGPGSRVETIEGALLDGAAEVWFVNDPMRVWHEDVYPQCVGKTRVVTNGFDAAYLTDLKRPERHDGPVRFGFLGTLTLAVPLEECLRGYVEARREDPLVAASTFDFYGYLGFYPTPNPLIHEPIKKAAHDGVDWKGPVPKAEVKNRYEQLDVLVLTFGGTRYITSGKVFEYMATGRPIVSVHAPENAVRDVLQGYPLWFQAASLKAGDVARAFREAAAVVASGRATDPAVVDAALAHAAQFDRAECVRPPVHDLSALVRRVRAVSAKGSTGVVLGATMVCVEPPSRRSTRLAGALRRADLDITFVQGVREDGGTESEPPGSATQAALLADRTWVSHIAPDALVEDRIEALQLAEPGTAAGRRRDLYRALAQQPEVRLRVASVGPTALVHDWVEAADRAVRNPAPVLWAQGMTALPAVVWAASVTPGARVLLDAHDVVSRLAAMPSELVEQWEATLRQYLPEVGLVLVGSAADGEALRERGAVSVAVVPDGALPMTARGPGLRAAIGVPAPRPLAALASHASTPEEREALIGLLREVPELQVVAVLAEGESSHHFGASLERAGLGGRLHLVDGDPDGLAADLVDVDVALWLEDDPDQVPSQLFDVIAAGVPSVARAGSAVASIVASRGLGSDDAAGLAAAVRRVLGDSALRAAVRAAAVEDAVEAQAREARLLDAVSRLLGEAALEPMRRAQTDMGAVDERPRHVTPPTTPVVAAPTRTAGGTPR